jgi:hypothetical protein
MRKQLAGKHSQEMSFSQSAVHHNMVLNLICCVTIGLGACISEFSEEDKLESIENSIIVGPDSLSASCDGYTSGGGQRVHGLVHFLSSDLSTTVHATASNWTKVLGGWVAKRTAQLRIVGTVTAVSTAFGTRGDVCTFDEDTGGSLLPVIIRTCVLPRRSGLDGYDIQLSFFGRHGSVCSP